MVWVPAPAEEGLKVFPEIPGPEKVPPVGDPDKVTEGSETQAVPGNPEID